MNISPPPDTCHLFLGNWLLLPDNSLLLKKMEYDNRNVNHIFIII